MKFHTRSKEETEALGFATAKTLPPNTILCLFGDLGAGKTTFVKGIAAGLGIDPAQVNSPTFVIMNMYQGDKALYHFDLYRLTDQDEFLSMGFEEYLFGGGVSCVEWSERIADLIPPHAIQVHFKHCGEEEREVLIIPGKES